MLMFDIFAVAPDEPLAESIAVTRCCHAAAERSHACRTNRRIPSSPPAALSSSAARADRCSADIADTARTVGGWRGTSALGDGGATIDGARSIVLALGIGGAPAGGPPPPSPGFW